LPHFQEFDVQSPLAERILRLRLNLLENLDILASVTSAAN